MKPMVMEWLFPTPVATFDLSNFVTREIDDVLQKIGYTSNDLVDGIRGNQDPSKIPQLKPLYDKFQNCIDEYSDTIGIQRSTIYESWMNILSKNGSVGMHRHYLSVVSGAYYPYVDEGSAPIVFMSSIEGFRMMDGGTETETANSPYAGNIRRIPAKTGQLILFPSWVQHYVPVNKTDLRITLSFNTKH